MSLNTITRPIYDTLVAINERRAVPETISNALLNYLIKDDKYIEPFSDEQRDATLGRYEDQIGIRKQTITELQAAKGFAMHRNYIIFRNRRSLSKLQALHEELTNATRHKGEWLTLTRKGKRYLRVLENKKARYAP